MSRLRTATWRAGPWCRLPGGAGAGAVDALLALLIGVSIIPLIPFVVDGGIDPSWGVGLQMATHNRLVFGRDVLFTYGPLGFLAAPSMAVPSLGLLAYALRVPVTAGVASLVLRSLRRVMPGPLCGVQAAIVTVPIAWTVAGTLSRGGDIVVVPLVVLGAVVCARLLAPTPARPLSRRSHALLGLAAGVAVLVKFDVGLAAVALVIGEAVVGPGAERRFRSAGVRLAGVLVGVLGGWVLSGQPLGALAPWLRGSIDVTVGYGPAMQWSNHPGWSTPVLVVAGVLTAASVGMRLRQPRLPRRQVLVGLVTLGGLVTVVAFQSMRRYDGGHALRLVALFAVLNVVFAVRRNLLPVAASLTLLCVAALGLSMPGPELPAFGEIGDPPFLHPSNGWRVVYRTLDFAVSPAKRTGRVAREHDRLGVELQIPLAVRDVARGRTVHAEPWETTAVWVHGWKWRPLPVFQSYSAYTHYLDSLNARALTDRATAPEVVITQDQAIDGRVPRFSSPDTQYALVCNYRHVVGAGGWSAWERRASSACDTPVVREAREVRADEVVDLAPWLEGDDVVSVSFSSVSGSGIPPFTTPPTIWLRSFVNDLFQPQRLIAATASGRHVMLAPACALQGAGSDSGYDATVWNAFKLSGSGTYRVTIETTPYDCGA